MTALIGRGLKQPVQFTVPKSLDGTTQILGQDMPQLRCIGR